MLVQRKNADGTYCKGPIIDQQGASPSSVKEWNQMIGDEKSRRIELQHSQDMAIQFLKLLIDTKQLKEVSTELVDKYTKHFFDDVSKNWDQ
jgi:hypothetical protein